MFSQVEIPQGSKIPQFKVQSEEHANIRGWEYEMIGSAKAVVQNYLKLTGKKQKDLHAVSTPCLDDHMFTEADFTSKGELEDLAAKIVLKALYLARLGRPDIYWAVNSLAREVTRWNIACDIRLFRLMCYLHHNSDIVSTNYIGDDPADCFLCMLLYSLE